jgi:hypothetical protein
MVIKRVFHTRCNREGVSEVLGTLFLLVMTVALFSVIILWVYGFDAPESENRVNLFPSMERINSTNANVSIVHRGGEPLLSSSLQIFMTVQNTTNQSLIGPYNYSIGAGGLSKWTVGGVWSKVVSDVPDDARVVLQVVDTYQQSVILRTELQRGLTAGGAASPILGVPVVLPDREVVTDGNHQFFIRAAAVDYDNDLPEDGLVADLTPMWAGLGTVKLYHKGFGIYESDMVLVPPVAVPGEYDLNVTATDLGGHQDTNWANIVLVSPDKSPPIIIFTHPTSGEIAAGTATKITATYMDPHGIRIGSVTMDVWEDDIPLDTSSKLVTDTHVSFTPFGGFSISSLYKVNVSVTDTNGNIAYAETIFRMATYNQPGNPQGETSFDVMNKSWASTVIFEHDDYIRVQLWSEVIEQIDDSELRLIKTDSSSVYIYKDRFVPNLTVPPPSMSFPWYVYDAYIELETGGAYGAPVPPAYYYLEIVAGYHAAGISYDDAILVTVKYPDGSLPDDGYFMTFNSTGRWSSSTRTFNYREPLYIELVVDEPFDQGSTEMDMAIISISEIYGDLILYKQIPKSSIVYVGVIGGNHIYRMGISLANTLDGATWFYGANWYPIEVAIQTTTWHWRPHPVFGIKKHRSTDISFEAIDQIKIIRPADISITDYDVAILHEDGSSLELNNTIVFGEELFLNLTVWNLGDVHITNTEVTAWIISDSVTLDFWELETDYDFWDPNNNGQLDAGGSFNYVQTEITWNTSKTGIDQATVEKAKVVVHIAIKTPVIGGYGSPPIPEIDYNNNDVEMYLVPVSDGVLTVSNAGYVTPSSVDVGELGFLVEKFSMTASGGGVRILGINVTLAGTAQDVDVSRVRLYRDSNRNGAWDSADKLADEGVFSGGSYSVTIAMYVKEARSVTMFLAYDISGTATAGRTVGSAFNAASDFYVDETATVASIGFPMASDSATIAANKNELTGAITGPSKSFEGLTATYKLRLNAFNIDPMKPFDGSLTITQLDIHVRDSNNIWFVWLLDDGLQVIAYYPAAPVVSFTGLSYTVPAAGGRDIYVLLNIKDGTPAGRMIGMSIKAVDVTLSTVQDSVDPALDLTMNTIIEVMADYFEYKAGDPLLDDDTKTVLYNITIGLTEDLDVFLAGVNISWSGGTPDYTMRIYIDGILKFEDDGLNHMYNGFDVLFSSPARLDLFGKSVRIEFDIQVTKMNPKKKIYSNNDLYFEWIFLDGSRATGGQYVVIDGYERGFDIFWQTI